MALVLVETTFVIIVEFFLDAVDIAVVVVVIVVAVALLVVTGPFIFICGQ